MKDTLLQHNSDLISTLVDEGYLEADNTIETFKAKGFKPESEKIEGFLIGHRLITKDLLGQALAESYKLPYADLNSNSPKREWQTIVPLELRQQLKLVVFKLDSKEVNFTTSQPDKLLEILDKEFESGNDESFKEQDKDTFLGKIKHGFRKKSAPQITKPSLREYLNDLFDGRELLLSYSLDSDVNLVLRSERPTLNSKFDTLLSVNGDQVAIKMLDEILSEALIRRASDIHFDVESDKVTLRLRIDGVLQTTAILPLKTYESLLNRLKIQANLRIDEHQEPQDGAIRYKSQELQGQEVDLRLSVIPTMNGEKAEMRVLGSYLQQLTLTDLGLSKSQQVLINNEIKQPHGMILVTGPTGSGKTTSLYAAIKLLNEPTRNITTIEDPVEYRIRGINQIQVNDNTNLSFSSGLRSILRQDPDVILVGEIRDEETASIAINAALTGHLLFSTFHANDSTTAVPRLLDMQIESYLLASTLNLIIAQRLVRKLCLDCAYSIEYGYQELAEIIPQPERFLAVKPGAKKSVRLYQAKGCNSCNNLGYSGRIGLFEILNVTPELEDLIVHKPSSKEIYDLARTQGLETLFEDGISKALQGITSIQEVLRVAQPPADTN